MFLVTLSNYEACFYTAHYLINLIWVFPYYQLPNSIFFKINSYPECRARHTKAELRQRRCSVDGAKGFCCSDNAVVNANRLSGSIAKEKAKQDHIEEIDYYDYDVGVKSGGSSSGPKL